MGGVSVFGNLVIRTPISSALETSVSRLTGVRFSRAEGDESQLMSFWVGLKNLSEQCLADEARQRGRRGEV